VVHINPAKLSAELYYRPNVNNDNSIISENVLNLLDYAG